MAHVYPFTGPRVYPSRFKHGNSSVKTAVVSGSVSGDIISKMVSSIPIAPIHKFVPVKNYEDYVSDLKKHGMSDGDAAAVYEKHHIAMEPYKIAPVVGGIKRIVQPIIPLSLILLIDEAKGTVGVKLDTLSWKVHEKYFFRGIKPPQGVYVRSLMSAGHTEESCLKVIAKYKWFVDNDQAMQDELDRVWPSSKTKKAEAVKKVLKAVKKL